MACGCSPFPCLERDIDSPCTVTPLPHPSLSSCESLERVNLQLALVPGLSAVIYAAVAGLQRPASRAEDERIFISPCAAHPARTMCFISCLPCASWVIKLIANS